jgi:hypothetical protein
MPDLTAHTAFGRTTGTAAVASATCAFETGDVPAVGAVLIGVSILTATHEEKLIAGATVVLGDRVLAFQADIAGRTQAGNLILAEDHEISSV